jgi:hypothetical protein
LKSILIGANGSILFFETDSIFSDLDFQSRISPLFKIRFSVRLKSFDIVRWAMKDYFQKISFNINADIKESERLLKFRHDSFFHAHFISDDREVLGHIDELNLDSSQIKLQVSY